MPDAVTRYARSAPVSCTFLLALLLTASVQQTASAHAAATLLSEQSTNLYHLSRDPIRVLVSSVFWLSSSSQFFPWAVLLLVLVAPVERRIGGRRTIAVLAVGHVGATLVTAAGLWLALRADAVERSVVTARDVGPSYAVFAVASCLVFLLERRLRAPYLAALLGYCVVMAVISTTFTDFGHLLAAALGLACYPLVRHTPQRLAAVGARLWARLASTAHGRTSSVS